MNIRYLSIQPKRRILIEGPLDMVGMQKYQQKEANRCQSTAIKPVFWLEHILFRLLRFFFTKY